MIEVLYLRRLDVAEKENRKKRNYRRQCEVVCHQHKSRAPAGRCKGVHLHPQDFAFQFFCRTIFISLTHRLTLQVSLSFLQSEIRQHVLEFHKYRPYIDTRQICPTTLDYRLSGLAPLEKILRTPMA